jgi:hypothetical protein
MTYPVAGFSLILNKIECMAHVVNLAAQDILKYFKQGQSCINKDGEEEFKVNMSIQFIESITTEVTLNVANEDGPQ